MIRKMMVRLVILALALPLISGVHKNLTGGGAIQAAALETEFLIATGEPSN